jgi:hypothetical protein
MAWNQRGTTLAELLTELAVLGLIVTGAAVALDTMMRKIALRSAAHRLRSLLETTQSEAATLSANRAVKFFPGTQEWEYAIYEDRNGNGVLNSEIASGVDRIVQGRRPLLDTHWVRVGLLAGEADPDGGPPLTSAVNFNSSTLCSFSMTGTGTPGTVYLTDGSGAVAVRSSGDSNLKILIYEPRSGKWRELS